MKRLVATLIFSIPLLAQIPVGNGSGGGGGTGGSGSPPIAVPFTAVTTITSLGSDTGRSTSDIAGDCYDNGTPGLTIPMTATFPTKAANGNIIWTWTGAKTGVCYVITGGASNTAGGDLTGTYPNPTYTTVPIAKGGTGQTTAPLARTALGLAIGTNVQAWDADLDTLAGKTIAGTGTNIRLSTGAFATNDCVKVDASGNFATAGAACGSGGGAAAWGSITGTLTDQTDLTTYLTTNYQQIDGLLIALAALPGNGFLVQTAGGTASNRTITGTASEITVTNGDGVSGDPVISLPASIDLGGKSLEIPNSTTLPGSCTVGQIYLDTNATSGQQFYACEGGTFVLQAGGGGAITAAALAAVIVPGADACIVPTINGSDLELVLDYPNCTNAVSTAPTGYTDMSGGTLRLPESTYASLPTVGSNTGRAFYTTDIAGIRRSTGTNWASISSGPQKFTVGEASLTAAGTSDVTLISLGVGQVVTKCMFKHSAGFTGGSLSAVSLSIGNTTITDQFCPVASVFSAASATGFSADGGLGKRTFAAENIVAHFTCTGGNCDTATAGSVDIWLWIEDLQ